ncbi:MAG: hypothetical protein QOE90_3151 [Thermoplasmata archaeon]|jgi:RimJ/RimL family protein N-acetyltransferase|nr:hypothetical protein [Thermoplasmata archaeon]
MSVFLRGPRVDVLASDAADPAFAAAREPWLLPAGAPAVDVDMDGEVSLVWAPARGGKTGGSLALADVDWIARRALLVAYLAPGAPRDLAREALALVVRYAQDELALERLDAQVRAGDAGTLAALAALGFVKEAERVDVVICSRRVPVHPR